MLKKLFCTPIKTKLPDGRVFIMAEDFEFQEGESYLVYAHSLDGKLRAGGCTRTKRLAAAKEDLRELGGGEPPIKERSNSIGAAKPNKGINRTRYQQAS